MATNSDDPIDYSAFTNDQLKKIALFVRHRLPIRITRENLINHIKGGTILGISIDENPQKAYSIMLDLLEIKMLHQYRVLRTTFIGTDYFLIYSMLFFLKTYPHACSLLNTKNKYVKPEDAFGRGILTWELDTFGFGTLNFRDPSILYAKILWEECEKSSGVDFIFIPLTLRNLKLNLAHTNVLIYTKDTNIVERFEPHGGISKTIQDIFNVKRMDEELNNMFHENFNKTITYKTPEMVCPEESFQLIQSREKLLISAGVQLPGDPKGFCTAWSIWFIHMRLEHPDIESEELQNIALENLKGEAKKGEDLTRFIRNYSEFIVDRVNELDDGTPLDKQIEEWRKTITTSDSLKANFPFVYI